MDINNNELPEVPASPPAGLAYEGMLEEMDNLLSPSLRDVNVHQTMRVFDNRQQEADPGPGPSDYRYTPPFDKESIARVKKFWREGAVTSPRVRLFSPRSPISLDSSVASKVAAYESGMSSESLRSRGEQWSDEQPRKGELWSLRRAEEDESFLRTASERRETEDYLVVVRRRRSSGDFGLSEPDGDSSAVVEDGSSFTEPRSGHVAAGGNPDDGNATSKMSEYRTLLDATASSATVEDGSSFTEPRSGHASAGGNPDVGDAMPEASGYRRLLDATASSCETPPHLRRSDDRSRESGSSPDVSSLEASDSFDDAIAEERNESVDGTPSASLDEAGVTSSAIPFLLDDEDGETDDESSSAIPILLDDKGEEADDEVESCSSEPRKFCAKSTVPAIYAESSATEGQESPDVSPVGDPSAPNACAAEDDQLAAPCEPLSAAPTGHNESSNDGLSAKFRLLKIASSPAADEPAESDGCHVSELSVCQSPPSDNGWREKTDRSTDELTDACEPLSGAAFDEEVQPVISEERGDD